MTNNRQTGTGKGRSARAASSDDDALFRRAMRDVTPLADRGVKAESPAASTEPARPAREVCAPAEPSRPSMPDLARGVAAGLDQRTLRRLRRGQIRPEATLDLHGMTRDRAHAALGRFLDRTQADGKRCVIVVTGKGRLSEGGSVLRAELPHWLNLPANRPRILGFAEAQPRDGGAGAVYVLLRRARVRE